MEPHTCRYRAEEVWGPWAEAGERRERRAVRVPRCGECGAERPARGARRPARLEVEAARPGSAPLALPDGRKVALVLVARGRAAPGGPLFARGVFGALGRRGLRASLVEEWLDRFLLAGFLALRFRLHRTHRELELIRVRDAAALEEVAHPGARSARARAQADARTTLGSLPHPWAAEALRLLETELAETESPDLVRALVGLAEHVTAGDALAERVFSVRYLGDSKRLGRLRARLESLVGPLEPFGIREGGALVHLGGRGALHLETAGGEATALDLARLAPYLALARELVLGRLEVEFAPGGLLVVENFACFEALCRAELPLPEPATLVWSAGYPGRGIRRLVEEAASRGVRVTAWADLDLDGVRIARQIAAFSKRPISLFRMTPEDLRVASRSLPLAPRAAAAIRSDLERRPLDLGADVLRAILAEGRWVEQEAFLATGGRAGQREGAVPRGEESDATLPRMGTRDRDRRRSSARTRVVRPGDQSPPEESGGAEIPVEQRFSVAFRLSIQQWRLRGWCEDGSDARLSRSVASVHRP